MFIRWNRERRDEFAATWPCCDVPPTGWADFDEVGDLVALTPNASHCENGGGISEFLADLQNEVGPEWSRA